MRSAQTPKPLSISVAPVLLGLLTIAFLGACKASPASQLTASANSPPVTSPIETPNSPRTTEVVGPDLSGSAEANTGAISPSPVALPVPIGTTVIPTTSGSGSANLGTLPNAGDLSISLDCTSGSIRFTRPPDISFSVNCVGRPTGISVQKIAMNDRQLRIDAIATTHWRLLIGLSE